MEQIQWNENIIPFQLLKERKCFLLSTKRFQRRWENSPQVSGYPIVQPDPGAITYYGFVRYELSYPEKSFACPSSCRVFDSKWMLCFMSLSRMFWSQPGILPLLYLCNTVPSPLSPLMASLCTHPLLRSAYDLYKNGCFLLQVCTWNQPH